MGVAVAQGGVGEVTCELIQPLYKRGRTYRVASQVGRRRDVVRARRHGRVSEVTAGCAGLDCRDARRVDAQSDQGAVLAIPVLQRGSGGRIPQRVSPGPSAGGRKRHRTCRKTAVALVRGSDPSVVT